VGNSAIRAAALYNVSIKHFGAARPAYDERGDTHDKGTTVAAVMCREWTDGKGSPANLTFLAPWIGVEMTGSKVLKVLKVLKMLNFWGTG
jgi:hypothetical protein